MKKLFFTWMIAGAAVLFSGCSDSVIIQTVTHTVNKPVYLSAEEFRNSVRVTEEPKEIRQQGKLCFYKDYLYISEPEVGIHIIDNRDPSHPEPVGFIELLGNVDLAIKNDKLYADSYIDLVWFDITYPAKPELAGRLENVFLAAFPETGNWFDYDVDIDEVYAGKIDRIIIGWETEEVTYQVEYRKSDGDLVMDAGAGGANPGSGINGSMSRFGLYQDYMYVILNNQIGIFHIGGEKPVKVGSNEYVGREMETIFPYKDCLFIGTPGGLIIYSAANPELLEYQSSIGHVYGCDPVVVENDLAYVTVRSGNLCGQNVDELIVFDVSNVKYPKRLVTYTMKNPKGLGIDKGILFLCDDGLKIFKADDPQTLVSNLIVHYAGMDGYDVIPYQDVLIMIADDGLYQYDYSDRDNIHLLSKLSTR
ncbi:MAG: hypothetical protein LUG51_08905 [Tannerellaceae bacterium]|nr:hypothetical protein [Tannerellaceae bacterium]